MASPAEAEIAAPGRDGAGAGSPAGSGGERRILHCDMDCFYAAVHMRDDPALAGQPVVIGGSPDGRGVVAAASYEARRYGVRSAMPAARALRLCPQAVFIRPDFPRYREESRLIFAIFRRFTDLVQPVSIDEAYLDVSHCLARWGSATAIAREIRRAVREERRLTVSIGVGPNKLVAKIASDRDKPDGLTVVPSHRVGGFLAPLAVRCLPGVGPKTGERLRREGIETVAHLLRLTMAELERRFGRHGSTLYAYARGIDGRPLRLARERKSLSAERTYGEDLTHLESMDDELERLARRVARGLGERGLRGATVTVKVRYADFTTVTRSATLAVPVAERRAIGAAARRLLRRSDAGERAVRLLGVAVSKLTADAPAQLQLFQGG